MVVGRVAVQDAVVGGVALLFAPVEVHGAVPRLVLPLKNCTVPVGPCVELLLVLTFAVSVTGPPDATVRVLGTTTVVVMAWVMVTDSVLLLACEL